MLRCVPYDVVVGLAGGGAGLRRPGDRMRGDSELAVWVLSMLRLLGWDWCVLYREGLLIFVFDECRLTFSTTC